MAALLGIRRSSGLGNGYRSTVASLGLLQCLRGTGSGYRGGGRRCGFLFWHVVGHGV